MDQTRDAKGMISYGRDLSVDRRGRTTRCAGIYGSILLIFEPCNPKPAISPCWLKMKA